MHRFKYNALSPRSCLLVHAAEENQDGRGGGTGFALGESLPRPLAGPGPGPLRFTSHSAPACRPRPSLSLPSPSPCWPPPLMLQRYVSPTITPTHPHTRSHTNYYTNFGFHVNTYVENSKIVVLFFRGGWIEPERFVIGIRNLTWANLLTMF